MLSLSLLSEWNKNGKWKKENWEKFSTHTHIDTHTYTSAYICIHIQAIRSCNEVGNQLPYTNSKKNKNNNIYKNGKSENKGENEKQVMVDSIFVCYPRRSSLHIRRMHTQTLNCVRACRFVLDYVSVYYSKPFSPQISSSHFSVVFLISSRLCAARVLSFTYMLCIRVKHICSVYFFFCHTIFRFVWTSVFMPLICSLSLNRLCFTLRVVFSLSFNLSLPSVHGSCMSYAVDFALFFFPSTYLNWWLHSPSLQKAQPLTLCGWFNIWLVARMGCFFKCKS